MLPDRIAEARAARRSIRIAGAGMWLDGGRPVSAATTLSVGDMRGIVEYVPGDLTLTARAGTRLSELYEATRAHGQWLPLDPWGGDAGTIGATVATATSGPHTAAMGAPRDVVLGLEFVSGAGETIRAGGRVVKNVAGFDLTRLVTGSWGTLGVLTEVTVRLRARPQHTRTVCLAVGDSASALNEVAVALRALPFTPLAAELVNAPLARELGAGEQATLVARVGGNAASVARQLDLLRAIAPVNDGPSDAWIRLRQCDHDGAAAWRCSGPGSHFGDTWVSVMRATQALGSVKLHGSVTRGVVRACIGGTADAHLLSHAVTAFRGTSIVERMPAAAWPEATVRSTASLERELRARFDPDGILNPGIMGDGT